jgi:hypothetical protein
MKAIKIISAIILSVFMIFHCEAQDINKFEKFQNRLKKGNSTFGLNINLIQHLETGDGIGYFVSPSVEYSYFLLNRFSINASLKFNQNFSSQYKDNARSINSQKSIDLWLRYYFFKRGGFFIDLGGSFGHILVDYPNEFGRKFYAAPKMSIGYSYMISNVWKKIDNKVSVNFLVGSYIPYKKRANFDVCDEQLPYFPFFNFELGVVYYFIRK